MANRRQSGNSVLGPLSEDSLRSLGGVQGGARRRSTQVTEISAGSGALVGEAKKGEGAEGDDEDNEDTEGHKSTPLRRDVEGGLGNQTVSPPAEDYVSVRLATDPSFAEEDLK